ncbi:MAG TPA: hypothetical protein DCY42_06985 [Chloroflexi bacterium]|nr:hypothetical protein [Chloroflexota bacterium]
MEEQKSQFKRNAMLIGMIGGALVGLVAANVFVKTAEEEASEKDGELAITPAKGLQIGVLVLGLLRQLSSL